MTSTVTPDPQTPDSAAPHVEPAVQTEGLRARVQWPRWWLWVALAVGLAVVLSLALAWMTQQRVRLLEQQLVARQQQSQSESGEALVLAKQSQDTARDSAARMALLEARVAEAAVQRNQLDELIQSLTRSRDENLLADIESALRISQQQAALTGSLEPLVSSLRQADERLARHNQPRLERVRRAVLRDLERVRAASQVDVATLVIRLDEVTRQVDDLPMTAMGRLGGASSGADTPASQAPATKPVPSGAGAATSPDTTQRGNGTTTPTAADGSAPNPTRPAAASTWDQLLHEAAQWSLKGLSAAWAELRGLVRITRIDNPEAVLSSPEQQYFLRENLKLRLLNARLALLSRQFDVAQSDLQDAQRTLERYFDPSSRRVASTVELLRQVGQLSRQVSLPRPDETLAALAAVNTLR
jgi:uroporphyrin-3 C-methyltransferase